MCLSENESERVRGKDDDHQNTDTLCSLQSLIEHVPAFDLNLSTFCTFVPQFSSRIVPRPDLAILHTRPHADTRIQNTCTRTRITPRQTRFVSLRLFDAAVESHVYLSLHFFPPYDVDFKRFIRGRWMDHEVVIARRA